MGMIAICIVNYNLPDMTDRLCERIGDVVQYPHALYVLDNGSDKAKPANSTTHAACPNRRTTGGWNEILMQAAADGGYQGYWLLCNDVMFPRTTCPLTPLVSALHTFGMIHPAYTRNSGSSWRAMFHKPEIQIEDTGEVEFNAPLISAGCLHAVWPFRAALTYGYGVDNESGYRARRAGFRVGVCHDAVVEHTPHTTYTSGADSLNKSQYVQAASENMQEVFRQKYGENWKDVFKAGQ